MGHGKPLLIKKESSGGRQVAGHIGPRTVRRTRPRTRLPVTEMFCKCGSDHEIRKLIEACLFCSCRINIKKMLKGCEWHQFPWNGEKSCRNSRITAVRSAESAEFLSTVFRATVIGGKSEISEVKAVDRFADSKAPLSLDIERLSTNICVTT